MYLTTNLNWKRVFLVFMYSGQQKTETGWKSLFVKLEQKAGE